jgi:hypothetical protein
MNRDNSKPQWAPKVARAKIQRLYLTDAQGITDEELIDEVGWALWSRCDSILTVTAAHYGRLACPSCGNIIEHHNSLPADDEAYHWRDDDPILCGLCGWQTTWAAYHQSYRGKQLFGANAVDVFASYHQAFPQAGAAKTKLLLIDGLIHAFHTGLIELGRPVGANLIQGTLKEVIQFLDALTNGPASAAGVGDSRAAWRHALESVSWARPFIPHNPKDE